MGRYLYLTVVFGLAFWLVALLVGGLVVAGIALVLYLIDVFYRAW